MYRRFSIIAFLIAAAITPAARAQDVLSFEQRKKLFAYDAAADLHVREDGQTKVGEAVLTTLSYAGAQGPVSASIIAPRKTGKHPAIVFMHESSNKRDEFIAEALLLAQANPPAVSLLLDAPAARPVGLRRTFDPTIDDNDRNIQIQAVIDIRRGIDVLAARDDVNPARIAYVGRGYGANWGGILTSIEPRVRAFVLIAGIISIADVMLSDDPDWADMRFAMGKERYARYVSSLATVDPMHYVGHSLGSPVLLQFGNFDPFISRAMAERFLSATRQPRRVLYYDSGHAVNAPQALLDRTRFLNEHLGAGSAK